MNSPRRHSRELALKALYQAEINNSDNIESLNQIIKDSLYPPVIEAVVKEFLKNTKASQWYYHHDSIWFYRFIIIWLSQW